jgi:hypothetical protein
MQMEQARETNVERTGMTTASNVLTIKPAHPTRDSQVKWALAKVRLMESVKRGPELTGEARDWFALKLVELVEMFGFERVGIAIDSCLEDSPFRPDISEIRRAMGVTGTQITGADQNAQSIRAAEGWTELMAYLKCYARRDEHGHWSLQPQTRLIRVNGVPVFVEDGKGGHCVMAETLPVASLGLQSKWCVEQIGGIARVANCPTEYIEIARKEFLKLWPLYLRPVSLLSQPHAG